MPISLELIRNKNISFHKKKYFNLGIIAIDQSTLDWINLSYKNLNNIFSFNIDSYVFTLLWTTYVLVLM